MCSNVLNYRERIVRAHLATHVLTWNSLQTQPPMERGQFSCSSKMCIWQSVYRRVSRSDPLHSNPWGEKDLHPRRGTVGGACVHKWGREKSPHKAWDGGRTVRSRVATLVRVPSPPLPPCLLCRRHYLRRPRHQHLHLRPHLLAPR